MKSWSFIVCYACFLVMMPSLTCGQDKGEAWQFRYLSNEDGLSQVTVNSVYQDAEGYMWFGTQDGLNRYDGYEFVKYYNDPLNTNSLSHSWIWDIMEDRRHDLWVASWSGLTRINPDRTVFTRFFPDSTLQGSIRGERPVALKETADGFLWVGCWGGGLNRYDPCTGEFFCFSSSLFSDSCYPGDFIRRLLIDHNDVLWIGTWSGLWKGIPGESGKRNFIQVQLAGTEENPKISALATDSEGRVWAGTLGHGLFCLDSEGRILKRYTTGTESGMKLNSNDISCLTVEQSGKLWIGSVSKGLAILDPESDSLIQLSHEDHNNSRKHPASNISSLYTGRDGLVWITSNGVHCYSPSKNRFDLSGDFVSVTRGKDEIRDISSLCQAPDGRIWIGTSGSGLFCLEPSGLNEDSAQLSRILKELGPVNISSLIVDENRIIWCGTRGHGLFRIDPVRGQMNNIRSGPENPGSEGLNYINGLAGTEPGFIWIATYDQGLICYDTHSHSFERFNHRPEESTSFPANYLLRIYRDSMDKLWICTWGAGIILFDPVQRSWKSYSSVQGDTSSLADNIPHAFCETSRNGIRRIWIGTNKGLSSFEPEKDENTFKNYYTSDGLPGAVIYGILENEDGELWISTNAGICRFYPPEGRCLVYTSDDGLQGREFNAGAAIRLHDGRFMFGGVNGFNIFDPDKIRISGYAPEIVITGIQVFDRDLPPDPLHMELDLPYDENFIAFEYAALDYQTPEKNRYRYRMDGVDKDWVYAGSRRYASYTNLDPGHYIFRVMGTNPDGIWSDKTAGFTLVIHPPFWQTWWFRILAGLAVAGIVWGMISYRIRKMKEIQQLRVSIASDLHDDIGASLTRIIIHAQQARDKSRDPATGMILEKIGDLSREVISTMSDIVWSIDARNDRLHDMLDRMRDFAYNTLSENDIIVDFTQEIPEPNRKINVLLRQNIFSVFKEAINNILKHSGASAARITIQNTEKVFRMEIRDNGHGFIEAGDEKGNGLRNMRMRAERIGGNLEISSGQGTTIVLVCNAL